MTALLQRLRAALASATGVVRDVVGYDMVTAGQRRRFLQAAQLPA